MASDPPPIDPSQFSPAMPQPFVVDPQERINHLNELLTQDMWQRQKANITNLIQLYESGEMKPPAMGEEMWLREGEVIDYEPSVEEMAKHAIWLEFCPFILQKRLIVNRFLPF